MTEALLKTTKKIKGGWVPLTHSAGIWCLNTSTH